MCTCDVFKVLKVARPAGECTLKTTSISELQNIEIKRDNYSVYTFEQDKCKYTLQFSSKPDPETECAARLFFLVQPRRFLIHNVDFVVDVVDAAAHKYLVWCFILSNVILLLYEPLSFYRSEERLF